MKSQVFKLCFGPKSFVLAMGKNLAKLRKEEDRWSQPAPTVGPTAPMVEPMQVSVHRQIFFFSWRVAKSVLGSTVRRWNVKKKKKKERRKRKTVANGKEKKFLGFFAGLHLWRRKSAGRLYTPGAKKFLCSRRRCSCVVRFAWTDNWSWTSVKDLYHERERENSPLFQFKLWVTMLFRFAQRRPSDRLPLVQRSLFFILEELRYEEPSTEAGRALTWPFFGLRTVFASRSDWRRKERKQTPVFVRSNRRKQKKSHRV